MTLGWWGRGYARNNQPSETHIIQKDFWVWLDLAHSSSSSIFCFQCFACNNNTFSRQSLDRNFLMPSWQVPDIHLQANDWNQSYSTSCPPIIKRTWSLLKWKLLSKIVQEGLLFRFYRIGQIRNVNKTKMSELHVRFRFIMFMALSAAKAGIHVLIASCHVRVRGLQAASYNSFTTKLTHSLFYVPGPRNNSKASWRQTSSCSYQQGLHNIRRACQINKINRINTTNRINNGLIDLCKLGSRLIRINMD